MSARPNRGGRKARGGGVGRGAGGGAPPPPAEGVDVEQQPTQELKLASPETNLAGPTDYSNWIIPDRFLMGAYPKRKTDLLAILQAGVTTFINLIHGQELERLAKYGPYFEIAKKELEENKDSYKQRAKDLKYIHIPIYDKQLAPDDVVINLVDDIEKRLRAGEVVFIHCRGGHGRTGTIVSVFLGKFFGLDAWSALELAKQIHDHRVDNKKQPGRYSCPETHEQISQVYKVLDTLNK